MAHKSHDKGRDSRVQTHPRPRLAKPGVTAEGGYALSHTHTPIPDSGPGGQGLGTLFCAMFFDHDSRARRARGEKNGPTRTLARRVVPRPEQMTMRHATKVSWKMTDATTQTKS